MLLLIGLLVFVAVASGVFLMLRPKPSTIRRRVLASDPAPPMTRERRMQAGVAHRVVAPGFRKVGRLAANVLPQHFVRRVNTMLIHADEPWSLTGFLSVWVASVALGFLLLVYIATGSEISLLQMTSIAALLVPMSVLAPYAVLRRRVRARQKAIIRALPDAMDLLVTSVEAGLGVDAAFAMVTDKSEGPLSEAFSLYLRQIGLGRSRQEALHHVAERTGVPDLVGLATSVTQGEELGTTLGDVLRVQAQELRVARRQRAETAAQRAPVLMTIPLALCFLPAMGAVIVVPSVLNLFNFVGDLGGS